MRSNRAGVTNIAFGFQFPFQVQLVATQHLTARLVIMSPRGMHQVAFNASNRIRSTSPLRAVGGVAGLGGITTATTITRGVRWIVFA